tara:strand:- start:1713 stop:1982 length:270 start_codon:yes stop_codon:yes gene_type:complete
MVKVENFHAPIGWLIDPHDKWVIHFDYKKVSEEKEYADFTIDMWGVVNSGKPMKFKSRRKVTREEALKTWNQLISSDWEIFDSEKFKTA